MNDNKQCNAVIQNDGTWKCQACGFVANRRFFRRCTPLDTTSRDRLDGGLLDARDPLKGFPGTELKAIIATWQKWLPWFDLTESKGCSCKETARYMDRLGPDGCEKNMKTILHKLEVEAKRRNLTIPFQQFWAEKLVRQAIRRARRKSK